jgi:hypothetical protein
VAGVRAAVRYVKKKLLFIVSKLCEVSCRKNVCDFESPGTHRAGISLESPRQCLSTELEYSCRYWIYHLEHSEVSASDKKRIGLFLHEHFLHWAEAMILLGLASKVIRMLNILQMVIPVCPVVSPMIYTNR